MIANIRPLTAARGCANLLRSLDIPKLPGRPILVTINFGVHRRFLSCAGVPDANRYSQLFQFPKRHAAPFRHLRIPKTRKPVENIVTIVLCNPPVARPDKEVQVNHDILCLKIRALKLCPEARNARELLFRWFTPHIYHPLSPARFPRRPRWLGLRYLPCLHRHARTVKVERPTGRTTLTVKRLPVLSSCPNKAKPHVSRNP